MLLQLYKVNNSIHIVTGQVDTLCSNSPRSYRAGMHDSEPIGLTHAVMLRTVSAMPRDTFSSLGPLS